VRACAKEKGVQEAAGFSLADLLVDLGGRGDEVGIPGRAMSRVRLHAGRSFKKTGRLGCSACWETFEAGLASLLKAMHKGDHHIGKVPAKAVHTLA
jgi:protein arginine kinase activator